VSPVSYTASPRYHSPGCHPVASGSAKNRPRVLPGICGRGSYGSREPALLGSAMPRRWLGAEFLKATLFAGTAPKPNPLSSITLNRRDSAGRVAFNEWVNGLSR
jgi:hypothetical protein